MDARCPGGLLPLTAPAAGCASSSAALCLNPRVPRLPCPPCPQVSPMDCTGCELCVHACPDNALTSTPAATMLEAEAPNWDYFLSLPNR